jgi:hypothetical protein
MFILDPTIVQLESRRLKPNLPLFNTIGQKSRAVTPAETEVSRAFHEDYSLFATVEVVHSSSEL